MIFNLYPASIMNHFSWFFGGWGAGVGFFSNVCELINANLLQGNKNELFETRTRNRISSRLGVAYVLDASTTRWCCNPCRKHGGYCRNRKPYRFIHFFLNWSWTGKIDYVIHFFFSYFELKCWNLCVLNETLHRNITYFLSPVVVNSIVSI